MKWLLAALAMTITLTACASSENGAGEPASGSVEPLPAGQVVLSIDHGGFVAQAEYHADVTDLVVYGDGRVFQATQNGPHRAATYLLARVDASRVAALVVKVEGSGLVDEGTPYGHPNVMDAGSVLITVQGAQGPSSVDVYALYPSVRVPSAEQQRNREELLELVDEIEQLADGAAPTPVDAAQVVQAESWNSSGPAWPGPPLAEFVQPVTDDDWITGCGVLAGDQAQAAVDAAVQNEQFFHWLVDGQATVLAVRPLLPHEEGCADL